MRARFGVVMALFLFSASAMPAFAQSVVDRAGELYDKGDYKGAIALLDPYIKQHPNDAKAYVMRGDAEDNLDQHEAALADYNSAIAINPQYQYAYATRCSTENEIEHYKDAVTDCTKAHELDPNDDYALRERSLAYFWLDDYQLAADDADAAIKIDGKNPRNLLSQCRAYTWLKRVDVAIPACQSFVTYRPDDSDGYFYRGRAEMIKGDIAGARRDFAKTLQLDDTYVSAYYWLAVMELDQKNYDASVSNATAFLQKYPHEAPILLIRATAYHELGQNDLAKADANQALRQYQIANDQDGIAAAQQLLKEISSP